ncbi:multidrug resistance protein fnx1 [Purpureocillium lavendulum]|uniref:Multidrug resistance protein fnx1 n=1 Tax=Purpureocillium lavendulum TaxID=1247861 RepID=A0AB34FCR1_9HYPO|nr:multidrug resistance protein fnx1 [Purpureocillium lavendulum]
MTTDSTPIPEEANLHVLSFTSLLDRDKEELANLVSACEVYGFFYLDVRDWESGRILQELDATWRVMKPWFDQPLEDKLGTETISDAHGEALEDKTARGHNAHTDVGSFTLLFTEQPGLQVLSPKTGEWEYIAAKAGHAIVNVADTLRFISGRRFKSAMHRVLPPGGDMSTDRYSAAYFLRAGDGVVFKGINGEDVTAEQWFLSKPSPGVGTVLTDQEMSNRHLSIIFGSVFIGVFLAALDTTIVATLSVPISASFDSLNLLSWLGSSYLIANAACQPLSGRLTDIFSRRAGLVACNILFGAGTLICGLATSEWMFLAGRVVAGMGGGGLNAISAFVASDLVPLRKRGVIQGIIHICYGVGAGLGGLFGGWANDVWGWRMAFHSRMPLIVTSGALVYLTLKTPSPEPDDKRKLLRVDFLGAFTLSLTLVLLLLGLNSGGNIVKWAHPLVLVSVSLSIVSAGAFVWVETKWANEPIIPMHLLLNRTVIGACSMNWLITMVLFMATFYFPVFFQSLGTSVASLTCGYVMKRTGKYWSMGLVVVSCSSLGFVGLSTMDYDTPGPAASAYIFLVGAGYGGMLSIALVATVAAVSHEDQAVATSATYAFRSTGATMGVTIASVVYQNLLQAALHQRFDSRNGSAEVIERILSSLDELKHLPEDWVKGTYDAYLVALRGVFLVGLGLSVLGLVAAGFIREHKLHKTLSRAENE